VIESARILTEKIVRTFELPVFSDSPSLCHHGIITTANPFDAPADQKRVVTKYACTCRAMDRKIFLTANICANKGKFLL
jgi:hypothetical protein